MKMFGSVLDDLLKIKTATCHMSLGHCYLPHQSIAAGSMPPIATYPRPQKKTGVGCGTPLKAAVLRIFKSLKYGVLDPDFGNQPLI